MKTHVLGLILLCGFFTNQVFADITFKVGQEALYGTSGDISITGVLVEIDTTRIPTEHYQISDSLTFNAKKVPVRVKLENHFNSALLTRFIAPADFSRNVGFRLQTVKIGSSVYELREKDDDSLVILNNKEVPINLFKKFNKDEVTLTVFGNAYDFQG